MQEKEFVPYELAVKLKELGFDEPCFGLYHICDTEELKNIFECEYFFREKSGNFNSGCPNIKAPTFSQSFRWFRERYNLDSEIYMNHDFGIKFYTYLILQLDREVITHKTGYSGKFKTHEEAEIACINTLIEIVRNEPQPK